MYSDSDSENTFFTNVESLHSDDYYYDNNDDENQDLFSTIQYDLNNI